MKFTALVSCLFLLACSQSAKYPKGGFAYPKHVADKDTNFYYYPLKDSFSRRDSFGVATMYIEYQLFNEPNLSLKPFEKDIFRLTYSEGIGRFYYFIILAEDGITVKKGDKNLAPQFDTSRLNDIEKKDLKFFRRNFPVEERLAQCDKSSRRYFYLDSLIKANPKLLDVNYYNRLVDKETVFHKETFKYTTTKIPLTKLQFDSLVNGINTSGFWQLPFNISDNHCADGVLYSIEANVQDQYKLVIDGNCGDSTAFSIAFQKIADYAGLSKEVFAYYKSAQTESKPNPIEIKSITLESIKPSKKKKK